MKKSKLLVTSLLSAGVLALAGCSFLSGLTGGKTKEEVVGNDEPAAAITTVNPVDDKGKIKVEFEGGTSSDQTKITRLLNGSAVTANGADQLPGKNLDISCTSNAPMALSLNTNYNGIQLKWKIDKTQPAFNNVRKVTDERALLEFNFPKKGEEARTFKMSLVGAETNGCKMKAGQALEYTFNILPLDKNYESLSIAKITNVTNGKFDQIDYNQTSPYFYGNDPEAEDGHGYHYVETYGEVVYLSPDGNWGLIQDGDNILEIYAGASTRSFTQANWTHLEVGKKLAFMGNLSQYKGNIQLGFVTGVYELPQGVTVANATKHYSELKEADLAAMASGAYHVQATPNMMNSLRYVVGKIVPNSWKDGNGNKISAFDSGSRACFDVQVGNQQITVAYDYHTTGGHNPIDSDYANGIRKMFNDAFGKYDTTYRFVGTMRYNTNAKNVFSKEGGTGKFEICPFETNHISTKTGDPNKEKGGCLGSVIGTSGVIAVISLLGTGLVLAKKKED